jgi:hypothetical protein
MKITIGVNPKIDLDAISVITKNNQTRIYIQYNKSLHEDLKTMLKSLEIYYRGKVLSTIENNNKQSIVLVF